MHIAFLGCGFITAVHSRHLRRLEEPVTLSYASRDGARAEEYRARFGGRHAFTGYDAALADPDVDAVVVAVPPVLHRDLTLAAMRAGKDVLVEKPALLSAEGYREVIAERDRLGRVVAVGENDHYKPLVTTLRRLLDSGVIGELVMATFTTVADKPKASGDWRNDEELAGGGAFFEEGIHWLHVAGALGPRIVRVSGHSAAGPGASTTGDRRRRSMIVAFDYDNGAVGSLTYSREIPSLLRGVRVSKLYGRRGVITFESNGGAVVVRGRGLPRVVVPGFRDIRGYQAMYADLLSCLRTRKQPEMSLEVAAADHALMEAISHA